MKDQKSAETTPPNPIYSSEESDRKRCYYCQGTGILNHNPRSFYRYHEFMPPSSHQSSRVCRACKGSGYITKGAS